MITARDYFQGGALADVCGLQYERIRRHYGKSKTGRFAHSLASGASDGLERVAPPGAITRLSFADIASSVMFDYEFVRGLGRSWQRRSRAGGGKYGNTTGIKYDHRSHRVRGETHPYGGRP